MRFLLIEDNAKLARAVVERLQLDGHAVDHADRLEVAENFISVADYDLILLDIMLPDGDGRTFLQQQRQREKRTPVIVTTARSAVSDRISLLDLGADDYITKPFSPKELLARTKALLRRTSDMQENRLSIAGIEVDLATYQVSLDNQPIEIGATEYRLLTLLMRNPDRVFTRDNLIDKIWGQNTAIETRTVDVHILRLRKLLKPHNLQDLIHTVRGIGYRFSNRKA